MECHITNHILYIAGGIHFIRNYKTHISLVLIMFFFFFLTEHHQQHQNLLKAEEGLHFCDLLQSLLTLKFLPWKILAKRKTSKITMHQLMTLTRINPKQEIITTKMTKIQGNLLRGIDNCSGATWSVILLGPHFLHWNENRKSWVTWYISETETN